MVRFRFEFGYFGSQFGFLVSEVQGAFGYFKIQLGFGFRYFGFRFFVFSSVRLNHFGLFSSSVSLVTALYFSFYVYKC